MRRALVGSVGTNLVILVAGTTTGILAARLLGPADRGLLAAVILWPALFADVAKFSLDEALIVRWRRSGERRANLLASAMTLGVVFAAVAWAAGWLLFPIVLGPERGELLSFTIAYAAVMIPATVAINIFSGFDRVRSAFSRVNAARAAQILLYLLGLVTLGVLGEASVRTVASAIIGSAACVVLFYAVTARSGLANGPNTVEMRSLVSTAGKLHVGTVVGLLSAQADRLVLLGTFDDVSVGHYVVAWTLAWSGLGAVTSAVSFVLVPKLAAEPHLERARAELALALRRLAFFLYAGVGASLVVAPWLLPLLFGAAFTDAVGIAELLLLAVIPDGLRQTIVLCSRGLGEARVSVATGVGVLLGFGLACIPLGSLYGVHGVAAATIVGQVAGLSICAGHLARVHKIAISSWLWPGPTMLRDGWLVGMRLLSGARPS